MTMFFSINTLIKHSKRKKSESPGTKIPKCLGMNTKKTTKNDMENNIQKAIYCGVTWRIFQSKLKKMKKIHPEKISYIVSKKVFLIFQGMKLSSLKIG